MRYVGHHYNTEYLLKFNSFIKVTDLDKLYNQVLKNDLVFTPHILLGW